MKRTRGKRGASSTTGVPSFAAVLALAAFVTAAALVFPAALFCQAAPPLSAAETAADQAAALQAGSPATQGAAAPPLAAETSAPAAGREGAPPPGFATGVLMEVSALRMFGIANTYVPRIPVQPQAMLGYGDFQIHLTLAQLYRKDGFDTGPFYTAFSAAVLLSPRYGWYHPQMGIGAWFTSLPRSSPEDAWETEPDDRPATDTDFFQSWFLRASPLRFGFDIGPVSIDVSLLDFFYGSIIPVTVYPGFRTAGNTVIGLNYGSVGVTYRWGAR